MAWTGIIGGAILLAAQGICFAGIEDVSPAASAIASSSDANANPYSIIIERNAFHLNPPPPPPEADKAPPPRLPEVKLSGFMRAGNQWKALLAVKTENPDPHADKLSFYLTLSEGDKQGVGVGDKRWLVELVKLDANQEKVDILNSGIPFTLSMKDNGFASPPPVQVASASVASVSPAVSIGSPAGTTNSLGQPWPVSPFHPMKAGADVSRASAAQVMDGESGAGVSPLVGRPPATAPNPSPYRDASNNRSGLTLDDAHEAQ